MKTRILLYLTLLMLLLLLVSAGAARVVAGNITSTLGPGGTSFTFQDNGLVTA